jgi:RHS repeat-associated protein
VSGPAALEMEAAGSYSARGLDAYASLSYVGLLVSPTGGPAWTVVASTSCTGAGADCTASANHTFVLPGTYYVTTNVGASGNRWCTGNYSNGNDLWGTPLGANWADCGSTDLLTVTVSAPGLTNPPAGQVWRINYYVAGRHVAVRTHVGAGNTMRYVLTDHLGSTSVTVDENGGSVTRQGYYPFGGVRYVDGVLPTDREFTGQIADDSTGLAFFNARYLDVGLGRFISADTDVPASQGPQGLNRYSFVVNNPLKYTDPTGHRAEDETNPTYWAGMSANEVLGILYGVVFAGGWSERDMAAARAGVVAVARALGAETRRAAGDAFRAAYGASIATPLTLLWGNDGTNYGVTVSAECAGITAGACTNSSRLINFASLSQEAAPNRPESMAFMSARNNVVHELGHALANRFGPGTPLRASPSIQQLAPTASLDRMQTESCERIPAVFIPHRFQPRECGGSTQDRMDMKYLPTCSWVGPLACGPPTQ